MVKVTLNPDLEKTPNIVYDYTLKTQSNHSLLYSTLSNSKEVSFKHTLLGTILFAWNYHYNLILKPDDVWTSIALTFARYINHYAEDLREVFVDHNGKKELEAIDIGSADTYDWSKVVKLLSNLVEDNVKDKNIINTMTNDFTTTTNVTYTVSRLSILKSMEKYFSYKMSFLCGIPSVELKGTKEDWIKIRTKLFNVSSYKAKSDKNESLSKWVSSLYYVIDKFIDLFDGIENKEFWNTIAHKTGGSGPSYISGWISVFNPFDNEMNYILGNSVLNNVVEDDDISDVLTAVDFTVNDNGNEFNAQFQGGFYGATIDTTNNTIKPYIGLNVVKVEQLVKIYEVLSPRGNYYYAEYKSGNKKQLASYDKEKYKNILFESFNSLDEYWDSSSTSI